MERKIGKTFKYKGKKLQVKEVRGGTCNGCFFEGRCNWATEDIVGFCDSLFRRDKKEVIFVEAMEQTEQPQELNLCEILKHCPKGWEFWSPMLGNVKFISIGKSKINVDTEREGSWEINLDSTVTIDCFTSAEPMFFPSKWQRDWSKFTAPWLKKEKFDPKTLKPFDEVVVRNIESNTWRIEYFSHINERRKPYQFYCSGDNFAYCIPYNDETKHLVGTTEEAPEYYRYWED